MNNDTHVKPVLLSLILFLTGIPSFPAALTADRARPFDEGYLFGFPGADYYVGDLSHDLMVVPTRMSRHLLGRWSAYSVVRSNAFSLAGNPLPVFDGIACPLPGLGARAVLPAGSGQVEFQDLPAAAWWGPAASEGTVQLGAPRFDPDAGSEASGWAGVPGLAGGRVDLVGDYGTLSGAYRKRTRLDAGDSGQETWTAAWRTRYLYGDTQRFYTGALDLRNAEGKRWSVLYGEYREGLGNFNEWVFRSHLQRAADETQEAREAGCETRTLFNMAGFIESQLAAGGAWQKWSQEGSDSRGFGKAFAQNTESFDALGLITGDFAFRGDFAKGEKPAFSWSGGLQGHYGSAGLYTSSEKCTNGSRQERAGLRYRPNDILDVGVHYTEGDLEDLGGYHGPGTAIHWENKFMDLLVGRHPRLLAQAQKLLTSLAGEVREVSWGAGLTLLTGAELEYRNRCRENALPLHEVSAEQPLSSGIVLELCDQRMGKGRGEQDAFTAGLRYEW